MIASTIAFGFQPLAKKYKWLVIFHNYMCGLNHFEDCLVFVKYTYDPITLNDYMEILDASDKNKRLYIRQRISCQWLQNIFEFVTMRHSSS